jgi:hypothetical protein
LSNRLDRNQFRHDVADANYAARRTAPSVVVWIAAVIAVILVLGGVVYGVKVAFAPAKGAGDTIRKNEDANNRIAQQRAFVTMLEGVKASDRKLQVLADTAVAAPGDVKAQADYQGTQLICLDQVAAYNAKAQETLAADWLPADLPAQIGVDPSTDCQPDRAPSVAPAR